jgi:hypothetical protein
MHDEPSQSLQGPGELVRRHRVLIPVFGAGVWLCPIRHRSVASTTHPEGIAASYLSFSKGLAVK